MSSTSAIVVSGLATTAVKGMRLTAREEVLLERGGVRENRRFYLIDERGRMVNGKQLGALSAIVADYDDAARRLTMTFPDGQVVSGTIEHEEVVETRFFSRTLTAPLVRGPWSQALSDFTGQRLQLAEVDGAQSGVDRGRSAAISLISRASLERLAAVAGVPTVDGRRFRMLAEIDGVAAHEEDRWVGRRARIGAALVAIGGHCGRCLVTSRDPDSGRVDLPTLDILGSYRRDLGTTEPLAFGVYGEVLEEGRVRLGDGVTLA